MVGNNFARCLFEERNPGMSASDAVIKETIRKEERRFLEATAELLARVGVEGLGVSAQRGATGGSGDDDDARSTRSSRSTATATSRTSSRATGATASARSVGSSSRMSTESALKLKLKKLEASLEEERARRVRLEERLALKQQQPTRHEMFERIAPKPASAAGGAGAKGRRARAEDRHERAPDG